MQAIRPKQTGGAELLALGEFPTPRPGPSEVLVRVEAADRLQDLLCDGIRLDGSDEADAAPAASTPK